MTERFVFNREWFEPSTEPRSCGTCAACCTWLGITELKKWTGQTCKHLDGRIPTAKCTIYSHKPQACSNYVCLWLAGFGPEELKPENSGILLTPYDASEAFGPNASNSVAVTAIVFDKVKADKLVNKVVSELLMLNIEVRLIYYENQKALLYKNGKIYRCKLLPPETFEELKFVAHDVPIATYETREKVD